MDKKEYQQVIEACRALATVDAIQRKLTKVHSSTDDPKLRALLAPAIQNLETTYRAAVSRKIASQKVTVNLSVPPFKALADYCASCIASIKPQWQILAEQHGWAPK